MLSAEADVNARNNDGATALMLATYAQKEQVVKSLIGAGARQGLSSALAFAEQAEQTGLAAVLREAIPATSGSVGWLSWLGWSSGSDTLAPFDLCFLPLYAPPTAPPIPHPSRFATYPHTLTPPSPYYYYSALGLMILGFMLLLFQLDVVDGESGRDSYDRHGLRDELAGSGLSHADLQAPRSRRDHPDLAQLTPRERRSLTCRLGEAYQRWNETEGAREDRTRSLPACLPHTKRRGPPRLNTRTSWLPISPRSLLSFHSTQVNERRSYTSSANASRGKRSCMRRPKAYVTR